MSHLRLVSSLTGGAGTVTATATAAVTATAKDACLVGFSSEFDYICRTLRRLGVPPRDVEDLVHEVFLILHRTWHEYDSSRALRPYLFGIAFRVASSNRRRAWRETPFAVVDVEDRAPRPDQALQTKQARALVLAALDRIPLSRRAVLVMHDLDEVPMRDVARVLTIRLFTAYSRLRKARREFEMAVIRLEKEIPGR
jgi:RNA polymerase sigma-70 factor, ECF subfamily